MGLVGFLSKIFNPDENVEKDFRLKANAAKKKIDTELLESVDVVIDSIIKENFRDEAKGIINNSSENIKREFLKYYAENRVDVCCLILDKAKHDLIAQGKMVFKEGDAFGRPFMR